MHAPGLRTEVHDILMDQATKKRDQTEANLNGDQLDDASKRAPITTTTHSQAPPVQTRTPFWGEHAPPALIPRGSDGGSL